MCVKKKIMRTSDIIVANIMRAFRIVIATLSGVMVTLPGVMDALSMNAPLVSREGQKYLNDPERMEAFYQKLREEREIEMKKLDSAQITT